MIPLSKGPTQHRSPRHFLHNPKHIQSLLLPSHNRCDDRLRALHCLTLRKSLEQIPTPISLPLHFRIQRSPKQSTPQLYLQDEPLSS